jgi:hypothetical protein
MGLSKDIWRVGILRAPLAEVLAGEGLTAPILWLPEIGPLRFDADPFGLWRDGRLHVFLETYDYRDRRGTIDVLTFDADLQLLGRQPALSEPWHLSYPFVFEAEGEIFMLPEAHRSGRLTLYRAEEFPLRWTAHAVIALDQVAIDATPVFHEGRWWLFYTPATSRADKVSALHVAYASSLAGPWTPHPGNPVRYDPSSSRPGGTPLVMDGVLVLPMQDCRTTYGGAIRPLRIDVLTPTAFQAAAGEVIAPTAAFAPFAAGLHTLSSAGSLTLIDAKRLHLSPGSLALDALRQVRSARRRLLRR